MGIQTQIGFLLLFFSWKSTNCSLMSELILDFMYWKFVLKWRGHGVLMQRDIKPSDSTYTVYFIVLFGVERERERGKHRWGGVGCPPSLRTIAFLWGWLKAYQHVNLIQYPFDLASHSDLIQLPIKWSPSLLLYSSEFKTQNANIFANIN